MLIDVTYINVMTSLLDWTRMKLKGTAGTGGQRQTCTSQATLRFFSPSHCNALLHNA